MLSSIIQIVAILLVPLLVIHLEKRSKVVRWISPIILCYLTGIGAANIPGLSINRELMEIGYGTSVLLAIPLLLFSANIATLVRQVRPALFAFSLGLVSVISSALISFFVLGDQVTDPAAVTGMLVGVYTGGTPNMSAIGIALGVEEEVFILLNSADIVFSGLYFIFLLTIGKHFLGRILPRHSLSGGSMGEGGTGLEERDRKAGPGHLLAGTGIAILVVAAAFGLSFLLVRGWTLDRATPVVILGITTLGIGASFHRRIRSLPGSYETASYLLLVFAVAMGSLADFSELLASSSSLFLFCGSVVLGSALIHILLATLFRIDRDTLMIASTAAIFGPAFIAPVANVIGNRQIIGIGIALGLIGIAIGNYLGLGVSYLIR